MTVCIAAMHNDGGIVLASDKMLSLADATFEPKISKKVFPISHCMSALNAGDDALQAQIMQKIGASIDVKDKQKMQSLTVESVVELYESFYNQIRTTRIRNDILAPFDLDEHSFIAKQKQMSDDFLRMLAERMAGFQMPPVETIIAGIDTSVGEVSPHIYLIRKAGYGSSVECRDAVGYGAIGSGAGHVESQFMKARFHRHFSLPKALLLTYLAKKRAEIAPGVGKETDLFLIGPTMAVNWSLNPTIDTKDLDKMCHEIISSEETAMNDVINKMPPYLKGKLPITPSQHD